jgi:hypothetical protein
VAALPSGTVTFLFTDVEGSTRRWQNEPEAMRVLLVVPAPQDVERIWNALDADDRDVHLDRCSAAPTAPARFASATCSL